MECRLLKKSLAKGGFNVSEKKYLTLAQASKVSLIPISTLRKKIYKGLLPAYQPSKGILIDAQELEKFIRRNRVESAS